MPDLKNKYKNEVVSAMIEKYGYKNKLQVPKVEKVTLNMGVADAKTDIKILDDAVKELALISGQKPIITRAKKSIAGFNVREGMPIGCKVTLRGVRMYEFLERFINIVTPRIRDFRGLSVSLDEQGNCTIGIKEQIIFPEIEHEKVKKIKGMNVCITTTAKDKFQGKDLLLFMGMPLIN
ncbi:MAG: 50S ribosomal protein L5 [bacterium]